MKKIESTKDGIDILQRKYLGNGRYYLRGRIQGVCVGDVLIDRSFISTVDVILSVQDSKANLRTDEENKLALVEIEVVDSSFRNEHDYVIQHSYGN